MRTIAYILPFVVVSVLVSCETVVDVNAPPHETRLVAQSFFMPESLWVVRVTETIGFTSAAAPAFIEDAVVELWDGENMLERLARSDTGLYTGTGTRPEVGREYTLRVTAPGHEMTEGSDALPLAADVTAFAAEVIEPGSRDTGAPRRIRTDITIADPGDVANYYGLQVWQVRTVLDKRTGRVKVDYPFLLGFESSDAALGESEFDFLNVEKTFYLETVFPDDLFEGTSRTIGIEFEYSAGSVNAEIEVRRAFAVVVLSVSENFFRFWKTAGKQQFVNENPFAEPLRVHSNMSSGAGIFAGFQFAVYPVDADSICGRGSLRIPVCDARIGLPLPFGPSP